MAKSMTKPMHHPLKIWRFEHGLTLTEFGKRVGLQASALSQIENRRRQPSLTAAAAIIRATGGALQLTDFVLEKH